MSTFNKKDGFYGFIIAILVLFIILLATGIIPSGFTNREGWGNPYAARLVQCASDGLPGTQAGANCWGQLGPQGCPPGLPKCTPGEGFLGNGHGEPPVFYSLGNERVVAKSTRPSSRNNNLQKHRGAVEGMGVEGDIPATTYSQNSWREAFSDDVSIAASQDLFGGVESYINY